MSRKPTFILGNGFTDLQIDIIRANIKNPDIREPWGLEAGMFGYSKAGLRSFFRHLILHNIDSTSQLLFSFSLFNNKQAQEDPLIAIYSLYFTLQYDPIGKTIKERFPLLTDETIENYLVNFLLVLTQLPDHIADISRPYLQSICISNNIPIHIFDMFIEIMITHKRDIQEIKDAGGFRYQDLEPDLSIIASRNGKLRANMKGVDFYNNPALVFDLFSNVIQRYTSFAEYIPILTSISIGEP